jgi:hypothetical protein
MVRHDMPSFIHLPAALQMSDCVTRAAVRVTSIACRSCYRSNSAEFWQSTFGWGWWHTKAKIVSPSCARPGSFLYGPRVYSMYINIKCKIYGQTGWSYYPHIYHLHRSKEENHALPAASVAPLATYWVPAMGWQARSRERNRGRRATAGSIWSLLLLGVLISKNQASWFCHLAMSRKP